MNIGSPDEPPGGAAPVVPTAGPSPAVPIPKAAGASVELMVLAGLAMAPVGAFLYFTYRWLKNIDSASYPETLCHCAWVIALALAAVALPQLWARRMVLRCIPPSGDCEFCGEKSPHIVCRACHQVQSGRLQSTYGWLMSAAAELRVHRWKIVAVVVPVVVLNLIALGSHANEKSRREREAKLTSALEVGEAGSDFRGALLMIETTCAEPRHSACAKLVDTLRASYFRYSFRAPATMHRFALLCADTHSKNASTSLLHVCELWRAGPAGGGDAIPAKQLPCPQESAERDDTAVKEPWMIEELNVDFRRYMNLVASCSDEDVACVRRRRAQAELLYERGRIAQCAVGEVIHDVMFDGEVKNYLTYAKCGTTIRWPQASDSCSTKELTWTKWPVFKPSTPETQRVPDADASQGE